MKKVLLVLFVLGLVGCGGKSDEEKRQTTVIEEQKEQIKQLEEKVNQQKVAEQQNKETPKSDEEKVAAYEAMVAKAASQDADMANNISTGVIDPQLIKNMGSPEMALCTAAALKAGHGSEIYSMWVDALTKRYMLTYPNKTADEIERYVDERVIDKKHNLESKGIDSPQAFYNYYQMNCES